MKRSGAGKLRDLIAIEAPTIVGDDYGGGLATWAENCRAWARVQPVSAREGEQQGAQRASTIYVIEVWQDAVRGITAEMRINWNGTLLNIREIRLPASANLMMIIMAESGVTQ